MFALRDPIGPIVSVEDVDTYLAGDKQTILDGLTADVRRYCGWHVTPVIEHTVRVVASGDSVLPLPSLRVESVSSVLVDGVELDSGSFEFHEDGWLYGYQWPCGAVVLVTMVHGIADSGLAAMLAAEVGVRAASPSGNSPKSVGLGQASVTFDTSVSATVSVDSPFNAKQTAILAQYRLPPLAHGGN